MLYLFALWVNDEYNIFLRKRNNNFNFSISPNLYKIPKTEWKLFEFFIKTFYSYDSSNEYSFVISTTLEGEINLILNNL